MVRDLIFSVFTQLATEHTCAYIHRYVPGVLMASAIRMLRNSVLKRVPGFDIYDLKPIENVDKAFIPALFVHGKQDDFILPSHSEQIHKKYKGEANIMMVEGDHNSRRPRYVRDSAAIFLKTALRVPDSYAIPIHHGMMRKDREDIEEEEVRENLRARQEQELIERAIEMSLREEEEKKIRKLESTKEEEVTTSVRAPGIPMPDMFATTTTTDATPKSQDNPKQDDISRG